MPSTLSKITPCIWLDNQAEQAAAFYVRTFPAGRVGAAEHYPESIDNPSGMPRGSVVAVEVDIAGQRFTLLNGGPMFKPTPSISFFVRVDRKADADRLFSALADGGEVLMDIDAYPWSERYGWVQDRFGVSWQVISGPRPSDATIVPCLMFAGEQHRRAEEAMRFYTSAFPGGHIESVERYAAGEGPEGTVKHGRFTVAGHEMVAMDSHVEHAFGFTEGVSLQVNCDGQREVDRYWDALVEGGGAHGPCGWLKDRFGVSWQVVPSRLGALLGSKDAAARERTFAAMMKMKKLDIAELERAFTGGSRPQPQT